ncbi:MAG: metal ABC transporter ATP-binding protein [Actinomycetota bacterium]
MTATVRLDELTVRYGDALALDRITFEIPAGRSVAVIGPNGSGKSTLLKAIAGIVGPDGGSVDVGGQQVAIVLQSTEVDRHIPLSVRNAVTMARFSSAGLFGRLDGRDRAAVGNALRSLGLDGLADRQIHRLSGGQRQRTFVAQGLAQQADVLLLDEPLTGLDVVSQSLIGQVLDRLNETGVTTIMTTHSFAEAEACDLVALLATEVVAFGPPAAVLVESNLRRGFGGRFVRIGETLLVDDANDDHAHAC